MRTRRNLLRTVGAVTGSAVVGGIAGGSAAASEAPDYVDVSTVNGRGVYVKERGDDWVMAKRSGLVQSVFLLDKHEGYGGQTRFEIGVSVVGTKATIDRDPKKGSLFESERKWYEDWVYGNPEVEDQLVGAQGTTVQVRGGTLFEIDSASGVGVYPEPNNAETSDMEAKVAQILLMEGLGAIGAVGTPTSLALDLASALFTRSDSNPNELNDKFTLKWGHHGNDDAAHFGHCFRFLVEPHGPWCEIDVMSQWNRETAARDVGTIQTDDMDDRWSNSDDYLDIEEQHYGPSSIATRYRVSDYRQWNGINGFYQWTGVDNYAHEIPSDGNEFLTDWTYIGDGT